MKLLITGVSGQLGHDCANEAAKRGYDVVGTDRQPAYAGVQDGSPVTGTAYLPLDITDGDAVDEAIRDLRPDVILHCAAWTAVDEAEKPENRDKVFAVNARGTRYMAEAARAVGAKMAYISTDYVFDGQRERPWTPEEEDFAPLNVYGESKLAGERAVRELVERHFIVRTAWVFGLNGSNFIQTMVRVGRTHDQVRVVCDQIGTPTYTRDLARLLVDMVETEKYGTYHATNEGGYISWYEFCRAIYDACGLSTRVIPVTTAEYGLSLARRPLNSRLDKSKLAAAGFRPLPTWQDALIRYLKEANL